MNSPAQAHRFTLEDFLAWEAAEPLRHEFIEGEAFAMTGGTDAHNLILLNAAIQLREHTQSKPCRVFMVDMKLVVEAADACLYPDVFVTCSPADAERALFKHDAKIIIEVLSPSTEAYDRGKKFSAYRLIDSLQAYVLIAQDEHHIEVFARTPDNHWTLYDASGIDTTLSLPWQEGVTLNLSLAQIYQDIRLSPSPPRPDREQTT